MEKIFGLVEKVVGLVEKAAIFVKEVDDLCREWIFRPRASLILAQDNALGNGTPNDCRLKACVIG